MAEYIDIFGRIYRIPDSDSSFWICRRHLYEYIDYYKGFIKMYEKHSIITRIQEMERAIMITINDFHDKWDCYQLETF